MGRKRIAERLAEQAELIPPDPAPPPAAPLAPPADMNVPSISDMCRNALLKGHTSAVNALAWAKVEYPTATINEGTFKATFSKVKNADKQPPDESGVIRLKTPTRTTTPSLFAASEPTVADLRKVATIAKDRGVSVEDLLKQVQGLNELASEMGGLDKLLKSLEALQALHDFASPK